MKHTLLRAGTYSTARTSSWMDELLKNHGPNTF